VPFLFIPPFFLAHFILFISNLRIFPYTTCTPHLSILLYYHTHFQHHYISNTTDGMILRVYFPVPLFVSQYWPYPEVQKAKDILIYKNNRESPEEKLADFFSGMDGIWKVMRRQKRLAFFPPLHAVFGGKPIGQAIYLNRIIPTQRVILFIITFFFNIYYSYESYYGYKIPEQTDERTDDTEILMFPKFINYFWFWKKREFAILVIAAAHFAISCSLALRSLLNSPAADSLPDLVPGRDHFKDKAIRAVVNGAINLAQAPWALFLLMADSALPLMLVACSGAALFSGRIWFYALCLVDLLAQIRYMSFIVTALRRNMLSISLTILLVVLFLYFFAVGAHLFFPNQYDLAGHMDCDDIG
jgi:hypothetical protein